jgi:PAS domain S-box-containing protein
MAKENGLPAEFIDTIFNSINDGVFTVDENWRVTSFNRAAEKITGIMRGEAIGKPCCEVFRANICESACALKQTMQTGKPVVNKAIYIVNSEGDQIPISISTALLKNKKGKIIGGVETFRDLSLVEELRRELVGRYTFEDIISKNREMQQLFDIIPTIATSDSTVLIEGESGTGKELFARAIHNLSQRKKKPFVVVNCGALPDTLLESELFGYKAGAFTDAKKDKPGRFSLADGGTIFLDEVGDISPALQVRLLRVLQEMSFEPLGATEPVSVNVRVVTATNKPLEELVGDGVFREDLYYRINVIQIKLPPLRERKEDLSLLIDHFVARFNRLHGRNITGLSPGAMATLAGHRFPGNVRELENIVERAFVLSRGDVIEEKDLPENVRAAKRPSATIPEVGGTLKKIERELVIDALKRNNWNRSAAARELGIHKSTLFRKIRSLGIKLPRKDGRSSRREKRS